MSGKSGNAGNMLLDDCRGMSENWGNDGNFRPVRMPIGCRGVSGSSGNAGNFWLLLAHDGSPGMSWKSGKAGIGLCPAKAGRAGNLVSKSGNGAKAGSSRESEEGE